MKLYRSISSVPKEGCVATIGTFDGVHSGHQKIIQQLLHKGKSLGLPSLVMTFCPSPEAFFRKSEATPRLSSISSRFFKFQAQGIDRMLCCHFNQQLSEKSAEDFIRDYVVAGLNVKYLLVGDDFRFGRNRVGDFKMLKAYSRKYGFEVASHDTVILNHQRVSSSRIRACLKKGLLREAATLLNSDYSMMGRVCHGDKRGRTFGFPTLNIVVPDNLPMTGVFSVQVFGLTETNLYGVANLGKRPTIDGFKTLLEVHLFNYQRDAYGQRVCVSFKEKIRDQEKFDSFDALKNQITLDVLQAKRQLGIR